MPLNSVTTNCSQFKTNFLGSFSVLFEYTLLLMNQEEMGQSDVHSSNTGMFRL